MNTSDKITKNQLLRHNEYYDTQKLYDELYDKSKRGVIFTNLMDLISDEKNILLAYRNIKHNKGSETAGTDGETISKYKDWETNRFVNHFKNKLSNYQPKSVRRVEIPKPNGKIRPLGIPCIDDRIIQQCIKQVLEPICEAKFHEHSYGFRPNRATSHAIARLTKLMNIDKLHYVVDVDIEGFFDNVDHSKLKKQIWSMGIRDKNLMCVIGKILKCEIEGVGIATKGTPQGGILSPLLSNIVLNELDWWISSQWETKKTRHNFSSTRIRNGRIEKDNSSKRSTLRQSSNLKEGFIVRYADDFKILCRDYDTARKFFIATKQWLKDRLKLNVSNEKSKITNTRKKGTEFLGFDLKIKPKGKKMVVQSNVCKKAKQKIIDDLKHQITKIRYKMDKNEVNRLNSKIMGVHNYYRIATHVNLDFQDINFITKRHLYNTLRLSSKRVYYHNKTYEKLYGKYKTGIVSINEITVFPIHGVTHYKPLCFKQETNNYTEEGRELVHKSLTGITQLIKHLLLNSTGNVMFDDNKISLLAGQNGKCYITGEALKIHNMECHHKKPRSQGGTDEYKNLVWINKNAHKLIHSVNDETIDKYLKTLKIDDKGLKRINKLRLLVGNSVIN